MDIDVDLDIVDRGHEEEGTDDRTRFDGNKQ